VQSFFSTMTAKPKPYSADQEDLARFARALSHPARVYIMNYLSDSIGKCCYSGDMAEQLPIARSTLSEHLKALKTAGLIQGEINPPYIKYCINRKNWELAKNLFVGLFHETDQGATGKCRDKKQPAQIPA
jgi:ArsR family transcriptional regulator, arsenate/arsenite/antimonite-responsive transcriptional repressor